MLPSLFKRLKTDLVKPKKCDGRKDHIALATVALMLEISMADEQISPIEQDKMQQIILEQFQLSTVQAKQLLIDATKQVNEAVSLHQFTKLLNETLSQNEKVQMIHKLWQVAYADTQIDRYEEYYIRKIADLLYVSHADYIKMKHTAANCCL